MSDITGEPPRSDTGPFAIAPVWVIEADISHGALRLYLVLGTYADNRSGECWPSRATLADRLGATAKTVDRWMRELVDAEAVQVQHRADAEKGNRTNLYTVRRVQPGGTPAPPPTPTDSPTPRATAVPRTRSSMELENTPRDSGQVRRIFDRWVESTGRDPARTKLDDRRRRLIVQALAGYAEGDVLAAVQGWEQSPWHAGENPKGKVYNDLGLLLRNSEKIEFFRDCAGGLPVVEMVATAADQAWDDVLAVVSRFGRTHRPQWEDPLVGPALRSVGGYMAICNATNVGPLRAGFLAAYRGQA